MQVESAITENATSVYRISCIFPLKTNIIFLYCIWHFFQSRYTLAARLPKTNSWQKEHSISFNDLILRVNFLKKIQWSLWVLHNIYPMLEIGKNALKHNMKEKCIWHLTSYLRVFCGRDSTLPACSKLYFFSAEINNSEYLQVF